jgi:hypothetical protein
LGRFGVAGSLAAGFAIAVSSFGVVQASRAIGASSVTYSCSSGTACITAKSTGSGTWAVYGTGSSADGVHGVTASTNGQSGVSGIATGTSGSAHGVYGRSANGVGVYGTTSALLSYGVEGITGTGGASGVIGWQTGTGGNGGYGVTAESEDKSGTWAALFAYSPYAQTPLFYALNYANQTSCTIDPNANLFCSGSITGNFARMHHRTHAGVKVLSYAAESTTATLEDVGTARMVDGVANVPIERGFAQTIEHNGDYHVFLTPMGDTRGLYVAFKTADGFQVRESQGGRSTVAFDYRIVARPADAKSDRLPVEPAQVNPPLGAAGRQ